SGTPSFPGATSVQVGANTWEQNLPSVHYDEGGTRNQFMVLWSDHRNDSWGDIYLARMKSDTFQNVDFATNGILISSSGGGQETVPVAATDQTSYLVVWTDHRRGWLSPDIYASLVKADGTILVQDIFVSTASGVQDSPAVAFDGIDYYVVWGDGRNSTTDIY